MQGLKVALKTKKVPTYKGSVYKEERVISLTIKPDAEIHSHNAFLKRLAKALVEDFTTMKVDEQGLVVITRHLKA